MFEESSDELACGDSYISHDEIRSARRQMRLSWAYSQPMVRRDDDDGSVDSELSRCASPACKSRLGKYRNAE
jgi:hypothetical protein